ncbi:MAG: tRNA uridine-5-carboxymethylaminomethyl(34) synthesis GTPase MnmE [Opitutales bacterium]|nr:tRNA uridine-5-carboxymethylaminomethyl(34) synthesis GTPase MnmE [Opitutales bacterium]
MSANDSIVAAATPIGESAIAVVRVSGALCPKLCKDALRVPYPTPRRSSLAGYRDINECLIDDVIFVFYEEQSSYTGEPSLEISSHGNPLITKKIIEDLVARGCRLADPGEYTKRAFLSGRMDLTQAESVATLIKASSDRALEVARIQLRGDLGKKIRDLQSRLLDLQANLEAYIDFPEEDLPAEEMKGPSSALANLIAEVDHLSQSAGCAQLLEAGIRCLIVGSPNAGKSSLYNLLCGEERAIVSEESGTTRDYLSSRIEIGPFMVEMMDTAGLCEGGSTVERLGIERTLQLSEEADCFLFVLDSALPSPDSVGKVLAENINAENCLILENKIDLDDSKDFHGFLPDLQHLRLSIETGEGLDHCRTAIELMMQKLIPPPSEDCIIVNARHAANLAISGDFLREAHRLLLEDMSIELSLVEITSGIDALGEIVGKTDNEDMLDRLFNSFCIGK